MNLPSRDRFEACLLAGAVGDALGYLIEFDKLERIRQQFGPAGLDDLRPEGTAASDDTQMTLFTAEALLRALNRELEKGIPGALPDILHHSYLRWLHTQGHPLGAAPGSGLLLQRPELFHRRAPGNTCVSALASGTAGTVAMPINNSKGCGGVMRAAPVGLAFWRDARLAFDWGAKAAAITHGHPSGYLSAGYLAALVAELVRGRSLEQAQAVADALLREREKHEETLHALEKARLLARTGEPSPEQIEQVGQGWVGEEALAMALYSVLRFPDDPRACLLLAVNHGGDSDSTGAIAGNILGAMLGDRAIPADWRGKVDLWDITQTVAQDLHTHFVAHRPFDPEAARRWPGG